MKGNHSIKFGGNLQKAYTNSLRNRARTGLLIYGYYPSYGYAQSCSSLSDPNAVSRCAALEQLLLGKVDDANRNFGDTHRHLNQKSFGVYASDDWKIKPRLTVTLGLRYELNGALSEKNNIGSNFIPGQGFVTLGHGIDRLYNLDKSDFGPRLGFAWDVFGNGKTAVRGGYSLTYDVANFAAIAAPYSFAHARAGAFTQPNLGPHSSLGVDFAANNSNGLPPEDTGCSNDPNGEGTGFVCLDIPVFGPDAGTSNAPGPFNAFSVIRNLKTPRAHNFNLSIQHEISRNNVLTIGYSGQRGQNLLTNRDINASPLGTICDAPNPCSNPGQVCSGSDCSFYRPFYGQVFQDVGMTQQPFGVLHVIQLNNDGRSQYDSLQASLNQRNVHGFNLTTNFTWSKCYDYNSVNRGGQGDYPQANNPYSAKDSYGLCDHDVRLNFNSGGIYSVPNIPELGRWMNGWQLSGIFTAISGRPFSVFIGGSDNSGQGLTGSSIRAAWDGTPVHYNPRHPLHYIDETFAPDGTPLSPFFVPAPGTIGNSRRNQLIGPGLVQLDMSLIKNTKLTERVSAQFRWEVFNVLNRGNFNYLPNITLDQFFGQLNQTADVFAGNPVVAQGGPRNMQFALKFVF